MALRVLLADESSTIKKAIQMVLSDYGVEVKTVPTGIDVLAVTQSYFPDLIIADILLTKKNGYEVCAEIKQHEDTKHVPVVLMWSSFMQLDKSLYVSSKADGSLEKPFDTQTIRSLVEKLVPKLQTFPLKGFLNYPKLPDFEESDTFVRQKTNFNTLAPEKKSENTGVTAKPTEVKTQTGFVIDQTQTKVNNPPPAQEIDEWSASKTNHFVLETENYGEFEEVKVINSNTENKTELQKKISEQIQTYIKDSPVAHHRSQNNTQQPKANMSAFDEQLLKEEIKQIAERICWQIIPDITEKIVREELNKLMQGIEKNT